MGELTLERFSGHLEPIAQGSTLLVPKAKTEPSVAQDWLRYNMRKTIRILCTDDRLFEGEFHCIDSYGNIILKEGQWINAGLDKQQRKKVGLALYTKKWIKKVYFAAPPAAAK